MTPDQTAAGGLLPELEAIAAAAHERLHAQAGEDPSAIDQAGRRVAEAASAAIAGGARLSAIADAERDGELRARQRRHAATSDAHRQAQARSRPRIRTDHRPRRPARTLAPRDRHRGRGLTRHHPRDPHPRDHHHHRQRALSRRAAVSGQRTGRARRIAADHHRPANGTPACRPAPGAPSTRRNSCAPRSWCSASHSVRS